LQNWSLCDLHALRGSSLNGKDGDWKAGQAWLEGWNSDWTQLWLVKQMCYTVWVKIQLLESSVYTSWFCAIFENCPNWKQISGTHCRSMFQAAKSAKIAYTTRKRQQTLILLNKKQNKTP
jgi:hypothetical protein